MQQRSYTLLDELLIGLDRNLRLLSPAPVAATRPSPAADIQEAPLNEREKRHAAGLMRVNHAGEVAAQDPHAGSRHAHREKHPSI